MDVSIYVITQNEDVHWRFFFLSNVMFKIKLLFVHMRNQLSISPFLSPWPKLKPFSLSQQQDIDDYENITSFTDVLHVPCKQTDIYSFAQQYSPVVYSLLFILAVVGNLVVICVIRRYRSSRRGKSCAFSLADTFLLHLAVSDLLLAFTLPLFAMQWAHEWMFGLTLCKICGALLSLNRYSGILFLACISVDRYLAIVHAISSGCKWNTFHAQAACAVIWVVCLALSGVNIAFMQVVDGATLGHNKGLLCQVWITKNTTHWQVALQMISAVLGFGLPMLIMLYCYICIFRSLCAATRRQKRKSLHLIISLVSVFVICWAPYNCFQLADSLQALGAVAGGCLFGRVLDIGTLVTESLGLSHCALNPFLYGFVGVKFRRELAKMCKEMLRRRGLLGMEERRERRSRKATSSLDSGASENTSHSVIVWSLNFLLFMTMGCSVGAKKWNIHIYVTFCCCFFFSVHLKRVPVICCADTVQVLHTEICCTLAHYWALGMAVNVYFTCIISVAFC